MSVSESLCGFDVDVRPVHAVVADVLSRAAAGGSTTVACANPHSLAVAARESDAAAALRSADVLLPDGIGVVLASRLIGGRIASRVTGSAFFAEYTRQSEQAGGARYFFLGSTPEVLERLAAVVRARHPLITVAGTWSPPFSSRWTSEENAAALAAIRAARPDVLWVGMTAPRQETWILENRGNLDVPVIAAIGAVFDFVAGTRKRPPRLVRMLGLEWLGRLLREPRRLWRRTVISAPTFVLMVLRERLAGRRAAAGPAPTHQEP